MEDLEEKMSDTHAGWVTVPVATDGPYNFIFQRAATWAPREVFPL